MQASNDGRTAGRRADADRTAGCAVALAAAIAVGGGGGAAAAWEKEAATPWYRQADEPPKWYGCGAATAKMIIESTPVDGTVRTLAQLRTDIEARRVEPPARINPGFYTDPVAEEWVIEKYDVRGEPPAQNRWVIHTERDVKKAAGKLAWTLDVYGTPSATLVYRGGHWVAVTGAKTSARPRDGAFTVERIRINDPGKKQRVGKRQLISWDTWSKSYQTPNKWGRTYLQDLVSVIDPDPAPDGVSGEERPEPQGDLTMQEALELAALLVVEEGLAEELLGLAPAFAERVRISQSADVAWWVGFADAGDRVYGGVLIDVDQHDFLVAGWDEPELAEGIEWLERGQFWPYLGDRRPTAVPSTDQSGLFFVYAEDASGACCLPGNACVEAVSPGECLEQLAGRYSGDGSTCDVDCLPHDDCANAAVPADEAIAFDTGGATTDGPEHASCLSFGYAQVGSDVWFRYVATETGPLTVSTCGLADYDTKIAIYDGEGCDDLEARLLACNDDAEGCAGFTSSLTTDVDGGATYLLRVGGYEADQGAGTLLLSYDDGGGPCPEDIDEDGAVGFGDLIAVLAAWGPCEGACTEDLDNDGIVGFGDLLAILAAWGPCE